MLILYSICIMHILLCFFFSIAIYILKTDRGGWEGGPVINTTEQKKEFLRGHEKSSDLAKWPRKDEMTMVEKRETPAGSWL